MMKTIVFAFGLFLFTIVFFGLNACNVGYFGGNRSWDTLKVTATAYNSLPSQTTKTNPAITAWGDTLKPGMKSIAVSRDLVELGLTHNTPVKIEGFEGTFLVKDKMHKRWKKKIDIYMGDDVKKALKWGRQTVTIYFPKISPQ